MREALIFKIKIDLSFTGLCVILYLIVEKISLFSLFYARFNEIELRLINC